MTNLEEYLIDYFINNPDKVVEKEENLAENARTETYYEMFLFLPYSDNEENEIPKLSGYKVNLSENMDRAKFIMTELIFSMQGGRPHWDFINKPFEIFIWKAVNPELFKKVVEFKRRYEDYIAEKEDNRYKEVMKLFEEKKFVWDDPFVTFIKDQQKKDAEKPKEVSGAIQLDDVEIMDFSEKNDKSA